MEFLKKRPAALALAVIIVIGSTFLSVNVKLGKACQKVTDGFYSGVTYDGYEHKSIQSQLKNISSSALGLTSLAANYNIDTSDVVSCKNDLDSSLANGTVSEIFGRYSALMSAVNALEARLDGISLSDRDASGVAQYSSTISSAAGVIDKSGYNDTVRDFLRNTYNVFPANLFSGIAGVNAPELFE